MEAVGGLGLFFTLGQRLFDPLAFINRVEHRVFLRTPTDLAATGHRFIVVTQTKLLVEYLFDDAPPATHPATANRILGERRVIVGEL